MKRTILSFLIILLLSNNIFSKNDPIENSTHFEFPSKHIPINHGVTGGGWVMLLIKKI